VADGTIFERKGIVAAAIVTDPFVRTADSMAKRHGFPRYRYATMPNPIGNLKPEEIKSRARDVLPQILEILGLDPGSTSK
jgi:hypothetical protein